MTHKPDAVESEIPYADKLFRAKMMHEIYESLAPEFGYETRDDTKDFDPDSPNGKLMIEVVHRFTEAEFGRLTAELDALRREVEAGKQIDGSTSDGYHTFNELYEYRKLYNAALFNEWWALRETLYGFQFNVHKSKRHSDGELCFGGGWFIVQATLPTGQISNHYKLDDWGLFKCEEREQADTYDGHSPSDVAIRLAQFLALEGESR